jgi:uncharacterized protein (TIGR02391 family)
MYAWDELETILDPLLKFGGFSSWVDQGDSIILNLTNGEQIGPFPLDADFKKLISTLTANIKLNGVQAEMKSRHTTDEGKQSKSKADPYDGWWKLFHSKICEVSKKKFEDEHYADAVESAMKEINVRVKQLVREGHGSETLIGKDGRTLDGAPLMEKAFSEGKPLLLLDDLSTDDGKNIHSGYQRIFAGAMKGIRNPKAHSNLVIEPDWAIHLLSLSSLLMQKLDKAKTNQP